jgi:hypothetical protein
MVAQELLALAQWAAVLPVQVPLLPVPPQTGRGKQPEQILQV